MKRNKENELTISDNFDLNDDKGDRRVYRYDEYKKKFRNKKPSISGPIVIGFAFFIGIIIIYCLFSISRQAYEMNEYVGYAVMALSLIAFIAFYIVPVVKTLSKRKFSLYVRKKSDVKVNQRKNKKCVLEIKNDIIDFSENVIELEGTEKLKALDNYYDICDCLRAMYSKGGSIKKEAKQIISKYSLQCALLSAISQSGTGDSVVIVSTNMRMVTDIITLYGFRPTDEEYSKMLLQILNNCLVSLSITKINPGQMFMNMFKKVSDASIFNLFSGLINSVADGISSGLLTTVLGYSTISYLVKDFKLQNMLSLVDTLSIEGNKIDSKLKSNVENGLDFDEDDKAEIKKNLEDGYDQELKELKRGKKSKIEKANA